MHRKEKSKIYSICSRKWLLFLFLLTGCLVRMIGLGQYPGGINQDEAFAGYDAYSILTTGMDSAGNRFPVYLNSWGSGMNALETYLMLPFIWLFGLKSWVIRLPQCILACVTLYVSYDMIRRMKNERLALISLAYLAICPWHIMLSRWGLESNLAPGFVLLGLYFFVRGVEKSGYYIWSAFFYGLSLYTYATIWPVLPFILLLQLGYLHSTGKLHCDRNLLISAGVLVLLALPLVLFLFINKGWMEEIRLPFLTIPRLTYFRGNEISFKDIPSNFCNMIKMLYRQDDYLYWNTTGEFGLYYKSGLFLALLGLIYSIRNLTASLKSHTFDAYVLLLPMFIGALVLGCLIAVNVNRINLIHLPIVYFAAAGLWIILEKLCPDEKRRRRGAHTMGAAYLIVFICFVHFYFTTYQDNISAMFQSGLSEAVEVAAEKAGIKQQEEKTEGAQTDEKEIYVENGIYYTKILFYLQEPAEEYRNTVKYTNYPSAFLDVESFGKVHFGIPSLSYDAVYIISVGSAQWYREQGFTVEEYEHMAVAYTE